jgi:hypothetical protein
MNDCLGRYGRLVFVPPVNGVPGNFNCGGNVK